MKAESWIDITEKAFRALFVPHRHQVRLATCMLQEEHRIGGRSWRRLSSIHGRRGRHKKLGVTNLSLDIQGKPYVWNFIVYGIIGLDVLLRMD